VPSTFVFLVFFTFTQALYDEAKKDGWFVKSKKND